MKIGWYVKRGGVGWGGVGGLLQRKTPSKTPIPTCFRIAGRRVLVMGSDFQETAPPSPRDGHAQEGT